MVDQTNEKDFTSFFLDANLLWQPTAYIGIHDGLLSYSEKIIFKEIS